MHTPYLSESAHPSNILNLCLTCQLSHILRGVASPALVLLNAVKNHNGFSLMGRVIVLAARVQSMSLPLPLPFNQNG
jgi:hypothetical protein